MREDLENELEALNSIYGENTLVSTDSAGTFVLKLPDQDITLRLEFTDDYPNVPPAVVGTENSGDRTKIGDAAHTLNVFREAVGRLFQCGEVCLYDVIEDISSSMALATDEISEREDDQNYRALDPDPSFLSTDLQEEPPWTISEVVIVLKSVFVARCAPVSSPDEAKLYLQYLLDTDKKVAKATHNITAWRIKGENGVTFQDCDDDGEIAAGGRVLHLMQLMNLWNTMVVVTRWYGGQKLGPARFGIINTVARDAFVKGGFVDDQDSASKKKDK